MQNARKPLVFAAVLVALSSLWLPTARGMSRTRPVSAPVGVQPTPSPVATPAPDCLPIDDGRCHGVGDCGHYRGDLCPAFTKPILDGTNCSGWCDGTQQRITIGKVTGATSEETAMIAAGARIANLVLDSPCFKQWILAASYTENEGLTQQQIFDRVTVQPSAVDVEMYTGDWRTNHVYKTVGYENDPFDGVVHMNRYFVNSAFMVADNLIHEDRGHSLGFHHYGVHSTSEPYGMNYAFEGCYQQQMQAKGAKTYRPPGIRLEIRHRRSGAAVVRPRAGKSDAVRRRPRAPGRVDAGHGALQDAHDKAGLGSR